MQLPDSAYDFTLKQAFEHLTDYLREYQKDPSEDPDVLFCAQEALKEIECVVEALEMCGF